jgi:hypothetical protein
MTESENHLKPAERYGMVAFGLVATAAAVALNSAAGLLIVGVPALVLSAAVATNAGGFGHRVWASSTGDTPRHLSLRLFRVFVGGGGFAVALLVVVGGLVLILR